MSKEDNHVRIPWRSGGGDKDAVMYVVLGRSDDVPSVLAMG